MSRIKPSKLNAFDQVSAGQISRVKLANGPTYQFLAVESNVPPAEILKFKVDLGGVHQVGEILDISGADVIMLESYKGNKADATYIYVIPFGAVEGNTDVGQMYSGLVTLPTDNIIFSVELAAVVTPITPTLSGWGYASESLPMRSLIPFIKSVTILNTAAGELDYYSLPADTGLEYRRLHLNGPVTKVYIEKDGKKQFEQEKAINDFILEHPVNAQRVPQAGWFHVDFVARGWVAADTFKPQHTNELLLRMTTSAGGNIRALMEQIKVLATPQG